MKFTLSGLTPGPQPQPAMDIINITGKGFIAEELTD
jgi:hypothetical protein